MNAEFKDLAAAFNEMLKEYDRAAIEGAPARRSPAELEEEFRLSPHPYPGLRSFTAREGEIFFGRARNVSEIHDRLGGQRLVMVLGGSGSGKSSVIRAGLIPRLNATMQIPGRSGNWYSAEFRPREKPIYELACSLAKVINEFSTAFDAPADSSPVANTANIAENGRFDSVSDHLQKIFARESLPVSTDPAARRARAEALCDQLFSLVKVELDELDDKAQKGYRSGRANLLILIDQFEEVFRPGVLTSAGGRQDLLDLIICSYARFQAEQKLAPQDRSGLFLALTVRSEEVHKCAEHPPLQIDDNGNQVSLVDIINSTGYLLDLQDPELNRIELTDAIVLPAQQVFRDWGLPLKGECGPFDSDVVPWLLSGVKELSRALEHRPDQLPLLQHALQAMWDVAVADWRRDPDNASFTIGRRHLPGNRVGNGIGNAADLGSCLDSRANATAEKAIKFFNEAAPNAQPGVAKSTLQATFRALARRDDRRNWVRRFADVALINEFLKTELQATGVLASNWDHALQQALKAFRSDGYLSGGDGSPYDISHEALIRNWRQFQEWLIVPKQADEALFHAVSFLGLEEIERGADNIADVIPLYLAKALSYVVGDKAVLPRSWAVDQILLQLARPDIRQKWSPVSAADAADDRQLANRVLDKVQNACERAERARAWKEEEKVQALLRIERANLKAKQRRRQAYLASGAALLLLALLIYSIYQTISAVDARMHADVQAKNAEQARKNAEQARTDATRAASAVSLTRFPTALSQDIKLDAAERAWEMASFPAMLGAVELYHPRPSSEYMEQAWDDWAKTAALLFGDSSVIVRNSGGENQAGRNGQKDQPHCLDPGKAQFHPVPFNVGIRNLTARLAHEGNRIGLKVSNEAGKEMNVHSMALEVAATSGQICLSSDGLLLTISNPNSQLPFLFDLAWIPKCAKAPCGNEKCQGGPCDNDVRWEVPFHYIQPGYLDPTIRTSVSGFSCIRSIAPPDSNSLRRIRFTSEATPEDCSTSPWAGNATANSFVVTYVTGLAFPTESNSVWTANDSTKGICTPKAEGSWKCANDATAFEIRALALKNTDQVSQAALGITFKPSGSSSSSGSTFVGHIVIPTDQGIDGNRVRFDNGRIYLQDEDKITWSFLGGAGEIIKAIKPFEEVGSFNRPGERKLSAEFSELINGQSKELKALLPGMGSAATE
jgi:hypothetical protein